MNDRRGFARTMNEPQPGLYRMRLVKGGPWVAARIHRTCHCTVNGGDASDAHEWRDGCDRFPALQGEVDGRSRDPVSIWHSRIERIDEAEYRFLTDAAAWDRKHAPEAPGANPDKPIDPLTTPTLF